METFKQSVQHVVTYSGATGARGYLISDRLIDAINDRHNEHVEALIPEYWPVLDTDTPPSLYKARVAGYNQAIREVRRKIEDAR